MRRKMITAAQRTVTGVSHKAEIETAIRIRLAWDPPGASQELLHATPGRKCNHWTVAKSRYFLVSRCFQAEAVLFCCGGFTSLF